MANKSDKSSPRGKKNIDKSRAPNRRSRSHPNGARTNCNQPPLPDAFDPELLYIECGRCGAPVIWEPGRINKLLEHAGIDPMELDAACMLVTDGCPACGHADEYAVRIFRLTDKGAIPSLLPYGHA